MRKCNESSRAALLFTASLLGICGRASASLFATFSLNQALNEYGSPFSNSNEFTPVTDTALPFQQTVSQITATNGVTTTYSAYDNGSAAGLNISTSAYTTAVNNAVEEGSQSDTEFGGSSTTFSFTQPVEYTISYQVAGSASGGGFDFDTPSGYLINNLTLGAQYSKSGILSPGVYSMDETWGLNNQNNSEPANLSGTNSISLTFTAIPEPGSLSLLLLPAALLRRGRRRAAPPPVQSPS